MFRIKKRIEISASHHLRGYDGACGRVHGHNWIITVYCEGISIDKLGMLIDFTQIKKVVNRLDHRDINKIPPFDKINPTAENIAKYLQEQIPYCYKVTVQETEGNEANYEKI